MKYLYILILIISLPLGVKAQTATEIISKAEQKFTGNSSYSEITIDIIRPNWTKQMKMKAWAKGDNYSVSLITAPAKEKGTVFLKRDKEVWNYMPNIDRSVKFPPSVMLQNWMGTDLTTDDLVKQSSLKNDYTQKLLGSETKQGLNCWKIELTPKENVAVVWGKIIIWIDKKDYMVLQTDYYDEDNFLVNQMIASDIKVFDGKKLPSKLRVIPADKEAQETILTNTVLKFNINIPDVYFTTNYMKKIK